MTYRKGKVSSGAELGGSTSELPPAGSSSHSFPTGLKSMAQESLPQGTALLSGYNKLVNAYVALLSTLPIIREIYEGVTRILTNSPAANFSSHTRLGRQFV